ncbi:YoaK family protein [Rhodococcus gannanensis]|uniref:YoaK family protein n=1 Tax=Rhodococcus gannanensis TaxID=1960308 RepID=A0ABW4PB14_9NOCA
MGTGVDGRTLAVASVLAVLAGFVDAMGYIVLGGFFVSFMSGNTTRTGTAAVDGHWHTAAVGAGIIALFVVGVVAGSLVGNRWETWRQASVTFAVAVLIAVAAASVTVADGLVVAALALAMGVENAALDRGSGSALGLTYVTGTLVKFGRAIADALGGGPRWGWVAYGGLWLSLSSGVVAGALVHRALGLEGLWFAVAVAVALAVDGAVRARRAGSARGVHDDGHAREAHDGAEDVPAVGPEAVDDHPPGQ